MFCIAIDVFFYCIHARLKVGVYTENIEVARDIFHGIPLENGTQLVLITREP